MTIKYILLIFSTAFICTNPGRPQTEIPATPYQIEPLHPNVLNFLDEDLGEYDMLATEAMKQNNYIRAAKYYLYILHHKWDDSRILYNLACCYARMGQPVFAAKCLVRAVGAGYSDLNQLKRDPDFDRVRKDPEFSSIYQAIMDQERYLGRIEYLEAKQLIRYRIQLPADYSSRKHYPLVIGLHGRGGSMDEFSSLWLTQKNPQFIFVSLEAPYLLSSSIYSKKRMYTWGIPAQDREIWEKADQLIVDYIHSAVQALRNQYAIGGVYLLGHSQGVAYAYMSAIAQPDLFAGIIAFAGIYPEKQIAEEASRQAAKSLRIFITHGIADRAISIKQSEETLKKLQELGYDVALHPFNGGHDVPPAALQNAIEWMYQNNEKE